MLGAPAGGLVGTGHHGLDVAMVLPITPPKVCLLPSLMLLRLLSRTTADPPPASSNSCSSCTAKIGALHLRILGQGRRGSRQHAFSHLEHRREIGHLQREL